MGGVDAFEKLSAPKLWCAHLPSLIHPQLAHSNHVRNISFTFFLTQQTIVSVSVKQIYTNTEMHIISVKRITSEFRFFHFISIIVLALGLFRSAMARKTQLLE